MGIGMLRGLIKTNINKQPEENLREDILRYGNIMLSWINEDKNA